MPIGFLCVLSEPGELVSAEAFQEDWYDNEHVPLRLNHLASFKSGARYSANDSAKPSWIAVYDVDDTSTFEDESYTRLRAKRSPREAALIAELELLDRRTCVSLYDSGESELTTSFKSANPTHFLLTQGIDLAPSAAEGEERHLLSWVRQVVQSSSTIQGWVRTRAFECYDSSRVGTSVNKGVVNQSVPKYLVVHEFTESSAVASAKLSVEDGSIKLVEQREWRLYRAYPSLSQGNLTE